MATGASQQWAWGITWKDVLAALIFGAFELVFLAVAWKAQPGLADLAAGSIDIAWRDPKYLYLVAANIGGCIAIAGMSLMLMASTVHHTRQLYREERLS